MSNELTAMIGIAAKPGSALICVASLAARNCHLIDHEKVYFGERLGR
jgi:hypothetical protein